MKKQESLKKPLRRLALGAAAVLLLAGTVYGVMKGVQLRKKDDPEAREQSLEARAELPLAPWSSFKGEIQAVGKQIAEQYESFVPESAFSSYQSDPGTVTRPFATIGEAVAYIGLEGFRTPSFPFDEYTCSVSAHGDEAGRVDSVRLTAERIVPSDVGAQLYVTILTDAAEGSEFVSETYWTYEYPTDVELQRYATPGGKDCAVAVRRPEYDSKFMSLTGYLTVGSALYELNLGAVPLEKYETALQMLHDWADALD